MRESAKEHGSIVISSIKQAAGDELPFILRAQNIVAVVSTTVSLIPIQHVAAGTSREFSDDRPGQMVAQRGDGVGHVSLRALGSLEVCNLRVGKAFLIERSFF